MSQARSHEAMHAAALTALYHSRKLPVLQVATQYNAMVVSLRMHSRQPRRARTEQSPPRKPPVHSHWPRMQTPWPEHMARSAQLFTGCTRSDRHALQHSAGAIGTNSVSNVILHGTGRRVCDLAFGLCNSNEDTHDSNDIITQECDKAGHPVAQPERSQRSDSLMTLATCSPAALRMLVRQLAGMARK